MGNKKSSSKETFFYCNVMILIGLITLYYKMNKNIKEGVTNMDCCGGIEAGVHYSETDTKPPAYVRRCFKSQDQSGETEYDWSGFPCSGKESSECCDGKEGYGKGDCIATSKGGYCKSRDDKGEFVFRRRHDKPKPYIKRSNDNIIDVNNVNDMKDYFYDRGSSKSKQRKSPEMQRFMARRNRNEAYMEQQLINKKTTTNQQKESSQHKIKEQQENLQIVMTVTIIHILCLIVIVITIRHAIILKIQTVLSMFYLQYLKYSGKTI